MAVRTDPKLNDPSEERSLGARLRQAREAAHMSVGQIAAALFLDPKTIEALEADAFDRFAAPAFVRGYLRGYTRVLGLPSEPILEMYDRQGFDPPPLDSDAVDSVKQAHTSGIPVRLVSYAVGAVLVLLMVLWWQSQEGIGFGIGADLLGRSPDPVPEASLPGAGAPGPAPDGEEAGDDSITMAPGPTPEASRDGEPPMPSSGEGTAPGGIPADALAPAGGDASAQPPAAAPDRGGDALQSDGPPEPSPGDDPTPGDVPADAPAPAGSDASGQPAATAPDRGDDALQSDGSPEPSPGEDTASGGIPANTPAPAGSDAGPVATDPDRAGESSPGDEPQAPPSDEGSVSTDVTGAGSDQAEAAEPGATMEREDSATGPRPELAAEADSAAEADPGDVGRPEAPAPPGTRPADTTAGAEGVAIETAVTPLSVPETSPSGTAPVPPGVGAGAGVTGLPEPARSGLVLAFTHESWVEVYDRERTRLFFGLAQPGRVLHFESAQPFDVLLGYGEEVRVVIDGEEFDHTPYINFGVARFSVGSAPAGDVDSEEAAATPPGPHGTDRRRLAGGTPAAGEPRPMNR